MFNTLPEIDFCEGQYFIYSLLLFYIIIFVIYTALIIFKYFMKECTCISVNCFLLRYTLLALKIAALIGFFIYTICTKPQTLSTYQPYIGLLLFLLFGILVSKHKLKIDWEIVFSGLTLQAYTALFFLKVPIGRDVAQCFGNKIVYLLNFTSHGVEFVYGSDLLVTFGFGILSIMIFFNALVNVLNYFQLLDAFVQVIGSFFQLTIKTSIMESTVAAGSIFLGQTESPLLIKKYLPKLTTSQIHSVLVSGFATVSGSAMVAYVDLANISPKHLLVASLISAPGALYYAKLVWPETENIHDCDDEVFLRRVSKIEHLDEEYGEVYDTVEEPKKERENIIDVFSQGALNAVPIIANIIANLIAFIALVYLINDITGVLLGIFGVKGDLIKILSYIFFSISWLMGVPANDCLQMGELIGWKIMVNEFVAYYNLNQSVLLGESKIIAAYALCGFSNISSIGIMIGAFSILAPHKRNIVAHVSLRALLCGNIVCFITACMAIIVLR